ncbi:MAG: UDP-glucuronate 4-epimerase, partial [Thermoanaerobacter sp.]|nr:UDP-glucuronate 4-epimerase [Thermoanaerobacter sp.]
AMDYTATLYEVINLGNNQTVSLLEMVRTLEEALGVKAHLEFLPAQPGDVPQTWADMEKAERLLGFKPKTGFEEGVKEFEKWVRQVY